MGGKGMNKETIARKEERKNRKKKKEKKWEEKDVNVGCGMRTS